VEETTNMYGIVMIIRVGKRELGTPGMRWEGKTLGS
jgi:hypothetical protein